MSITRQWQVIYCRSRFEKKLFQDLISKGIDVYFPTRVELRHWHDRVKKVNVPVFPNYLFVQINNHSEMAHIYSAPGFVRVLSTNNKPDMISEEKISMIRIMLEGDYEVNENKLIDGAKVRINTGAFKGLKGDLIGRRADCRVQVKIEVINKYIMLLIPPTDLEEIEEGKLSS